MGMKYTNLVCEKNTAYRRLKTIDMKIFSSKRTEVTRSYGKLRNKKLYNFHSITDNKGKAFPLEAQAGL
jgi:hypothetical protein